MSSCLSTSCFRILSVNGTPFRSHVAVLLQDCQCGWYQLQRGQVSRECPKCWIYQYFVRMGVRLVLFVSSVVPNPQSLNCLSVLSFAVVIFSCVPLFLVISFTQSPQSPGATTSNELKKVNLPVVGSSNCNAGVNVSRSLKKKRMSKKNFEGFLCLHESVLFFVVFFI